MDFNTYQKKAHETAQYPTDISLLTTLLDHHGERIDHDLSWIYPALGLAGEAGELLNKLKKIIRDKNGVINIETSLILRDELGDILWYIAELCEILALPMDYVAMSNIQKLSNRA